MRRFTRNKISLNAKQRAPLPSQPSIQPRRLAFYVTHLLVATQDVTRHRDPPPYDSFPWMDEVTALTVLTVGRTGGATLRVSSADPFLIPTASVLTPQRITSLPCGAQCCNQVLNLPLFRSSIFEFPPRSSIFEAIGILRSSR